MVGCCPRIIVNEKGSEFDGTYLLKESQPLEKPNENCVDTCLYKKVNEPGSEFCFR